MNQIMFRGFYLPSLHRVSLYAAVIKSVRKWLNLKLPRFSLTVYLMENAAILKLTINLTEFSRSGIILALTHYQIANKIIKI